MTEFAGIALIALLVGFVVGWRAGTRNAVGQPMTIKVAVRDPDLDAAVRGDA